MSIPKFVARSLLSGTAAALLVMSAAANAEAPVVTITSDTIRAHDIIEAAARQVGGHDRLANLTALHLATTGESYNGRQGYDPANVDAALPIGSYSLTADFDFDHHQYRRRVLQVLPGGIHLDAVTVYKEGRITIAYPGGQHMSQSPGNEGTVSDSLGRLIPAMLLKRALETSSTATYVGRRTEAGEPSEIVDISLDPATRVRVHLDARSMEVHSLEAVSSDPLTGDDTALYEFAGRKTVDGVTFPARVSVAYHGRPGLSFEVTEVALNQAASPALFVIPTYRPLPDTRTTRSLGHGAYEISGLDDGTFRVMFFDLGDSVAVFDAPVSRATSEWVAGEIRKTVGDKPIKYLIVSHFHNDHVAGIGCYIDHGARIVTVRANAPVLQRYAIVESRLHADIPALGARPSFMFVDGDHFSLAGTAGNALTIYKLADCPHAKDMLIAYQPANHLTVEADLFVELAGYSGASEAFAAWMRKPSSPPIDRIIGTHLAEISRSEFERMGALARASGSVQPSGKRAY